MPYMYALYVLSPSLPISRFRSQSCKATHALAIEAHAFVIEASLSARGQRRNRIVGTFRCNSAIVHQKKTGARRAHCPPATSVRTAGRASAHANCPGLQRTNAPCALGQVTVRQGPEDGGGGDRGSSHIYTHTWVLCERGLLWRPRLHCFLSLGSRRKRLDEARRKRSHTQSLTLITLLGFTHSRYILNHTLSHTHTQEILNMPLLHSAIQSPPPLPPHSPVTRATVPPRNSQQPALIAAQSDKATNSVT